MKNLTIIIKRINTCPDPDLMSKGTDLITAGYKFELGGQMFGGNTTNYAAGDENGPLPFNKENVAYLAAIAAIRAFREEDCLINEAPEKYGSDADQFYTLNDIKEVMNHGEH